MFSTSDLFAITMNPLQVIITLIIGLLVGLYIWFIYKKTFAGVMYSRSFGITLVMMTVVTALMLMLINNSLTLSLGMVGALSIVRYRTAIKDPLDTVFIFWAVGQGIAIGTKFYDVAVIAGIVIGIFLLVISSGKGKGSMGYLLILHYNDMAADAVRKMTKQLPGARVKSKVVRPDSTELTMELRLKDNETGFVEKFLRVEGVYDATLITHQGDVIS